MSSRSVQFVRSVKFLTVRKLHVISDTYNVFGFTGKVLEGSNVFLRSVQFVLSVKFLTVCKEEFTVRRLHVISDT